MLKADIVYFILHDISKARYSLRSKFFHDQFNSIKIEDDPISYVIIACYEMRISAINIRLHWSWKTAREASLMAQPNRGVLFLLPYVLSFVVTGGQFLPLLTPLKFLRWDLLSHWSALERFFSSIVVKGATGVKVADVPLSNLVKDCLLPTHDSSQ